MTQLTLEMPEPMNHKAARPAEAVQSIADIVKTMQALPVLDPRSMNQVLYGDAGLPNRLSGIDATRPAATKLEPM